jgi:hypothetical protein
MRPTPIGSPEACSKTSWTRAEQASRRAVSAWITAPPSIWAPRSELRSPGVGSRLGSHERMQLGMHDHGRPVGIGIRSDPHRGHGHQGIGTSGVGGDRVFFSGHHRDRSCQAFKRFRHHGPLGRRKLSRKTKALSVVPVPPRKTPSPLELANVRPGPMRPDDLWSGWPKGARSGPTERAWIRSEAWRTG